MASIAIGTTKENSIVEWLKMILSGITTLFIGIILARVNTWFTERKERDIKRALEWQTMQKAIEGIAEHSEIQTNNISQLTINMDRLQGIVDKVNDKIDLHSQQIAILEQRFPVK